MKKRMARTEPDQCLPLCNAPNWSPRKENVT